MNNELAKLLQEEQENPNDAQLLTKIAFYYLENPLECSDSQDELQYFQKAYHAKPCTTTLHNLVFWAMREYYNKSFVNDLFPQLLAFKPKSFYPYMAYAEWLMTSKWNNPQWYAQKDKLIALTKAYILALEKFKDAPSAYQELHLHDLILIKNNLAVSLAYQAQYAIAWQYFDEIHQNVKTLQKNQASIELSVEMLDEYLFHILLNQARLALLQKDVARVREYLCQARQNSQCEYELVAELYAMIADYQMCYDIMKDRLDRIGIDWYWIFYGVAQVDVSLWQQKSREEIQNIERYLQKDRQDLADCKDDEERSELLDEIDMYSKKLMEINHQLTQSSPSKPKIDVIADLYTFSDCWLFGCARHHNLLNDDNQWENIAKS